MVGDTSIFIQFLRATKRERTTLYKVSDELKYTTSVTIYELSMGAKSEEKQIHIDELINDLEILPFDEAAAIKAAEIYHQLRKQNKMIEFRDIFIAAICIVNDLELVTLNKKHFERIKDLQISP
jgi:tRNA(fMet)-specific endonuclease VapC